MLQACRQVMANKGSSGVDGMQVEELSVYLEENRDALATSLISGKYRAQSILGVAIPKSNGKTRLLGIPTVLDRMLQQSVAQVMMIKWEPDFKAHSYGFRPNRNAQQAVLQSQRYINEDGYHHIVDIDLQSFFDEVDHCLLMQLIYRRVKCSITLSLIRQWLRAPILINGTLTKRRKGMPQGSPLSPLLSNILLHELDKEMEGKGLKYVRYADDFSIYSKTLKEARKIGNEIYLFLRNRLRLPINREKSGIRKPIEFELLGYKYVPTYIKGDKGKYQLVVSEKGWLNIKSKLKEITKKSAPKSFEVRIAQIKEASQGWLQYFRLGSIQGKLRDVDSWLRNRLRLCIWNDWKKTERKRKNLIRLGVEANQAYAFSRSRKGKWAIAQSPIMTTTITLERLSRRGYVSMLDYYYSIAPHYNESLIARPA